MDNKIGFDGKNLLKNILSQGHVEMILSFVMFAGFLVFIFFILNPFFESTTKIDIKNVRTGIIDNITSSLGRLSVIVNSSNDCYDVDLIRDSFGENFIEIADSVNDPEDPIRYTLYFGDFFDSSIVGFVSCSSELNRNYTLGNYFKEEVVDYNKAQILKENYESDYLSLRNSLGVGDFSFNFTDLDKKQIYHFDDSEKSLSAKRRVPENVDIFSDEILVRVIDKNGKIYEMILNLKTW